MEERLTPAPFIPFQWRLAVSELAGPTKLIRSYLEAMQSDDTETVQALSASSPRLEYPGRLEFASVSDLLRWSHGRHKGIRHLFERFDFAGGGEGPTVAYVSGTLDGTFNNGKTFSGVRFIYRFAIQDGKILETVLWSDMAELVLRLQREAVTE